MKNSYIKIKDESFTKYNGLFREFKSIFTNEKNETRSTVATKHTIQSK